MDRPRRHLKYCLSFPCPFVTSLSPLSFLSRTRALCCVGLEKKEDACNGLGACGKKTRNVGSKINSRAVLRCPLFTTPFQHLVPARISLQIDLHQYVQVLTCLTYKAGGKEELEREGRVRLYMAQ